MATRYGTEKAEGLFDGYAPQQGMYAQHHHAAIDGKLRNRRSVFSPHQKMRMNIIPLFLNIFVPWSIFLFCLGITATYINYTHPTAVTCLLVTVWVIWGVIVAFAIWARLYEPDPTWFTHFALAVGVAILVGSNLGNGLFQSFSRKYYMIHDLKTIGNVDTGVWAGNGLADVGLVHFTPGTGLSPTLSWHFKSGSLYCVSPILSNWTLPLNQQYDFWAVGKDCCSMAASDFRCGSWGNVGPKGGIREMDEGENQKYRLAVQQAESIYNIRAPSPIFVKWSLDPMLEVESWNRSVFKNIMFYAACAFILGLFSVAMHACRFSWLGRGEAMYSMEFYNDAGWTGGGIQGPVDYGVQTYSTA